MRLIDANALAQRFSALQECASMRDHVYLMGVLSVIDNAPTVDAAPVVHARWEDATLIIAGIRHPQTKCTACEKVYWGYRTECNYCPNCGAKMDGGAEC